MYSYKNLFLPPRFYTISPKAINSTLIILKIPRLTPAQSTLLSNEHSVSFLFFRESTLFYSLDNEVINSRYLSFFKKILKIKSISEYENRS